MLDCRWLGKRGECESVMKPIWLLAGHKKVGMQKGGRRSVKVEAKDERVSEVDRRKKGRKESEREEEEEKEKE